MPFSAFRALRSAFRGIYKHGAPTALRTRKIWQKLLAAALKKDHHMVLVLFAVAGFYIGYRFEMTRTGYVTMALTTIGFSAGQIMHLLTTRSREAMTMLPLFVGLVVVLFMLLGAVSRLAVRGKRKVTWRP